ncbi:hypothetical protein D3C74_317250 [compost metagenome]
MVACVHQRLIPITFLHLIIQLNEVSSIDEGIISNIKRNLVHLLVAVIVPDQIVVAKHIIVGRVIVFLIAILGLHEPVQRSIGIEKIGHIQAIVYTVSQVELDPLLHFIESAVLPLLNVTFDA